ncbi:MAG: hypothetical protein A2430_02390 [Candidatus Liptonbacteria bacterium RIFOXYC1_FULL_36_8]|uniref:Uncharacterized protein n=3 Tax=Candidatus Liptoniibacteriota TaxID=1817909 RepID=A0A1G2CMB5_9BACT|nr:MAG: hypothetical protein A2390_00260 [Candidatus Liptonbacteria bacterium RIFOXYB1_FULL_36_10]OGZ03408.1 MAG: hypothetical protein A2430_02390 [Candidatus Liptonbacteria bacterium RIFOXYC1_FULL_36_8]OGZ03611.1 MAG: hypothetical protein A2604_02010 [Candidatus Liptonbacteria bacterium RIFOXYD1_FULL_36_11]
MSKKLEIVPVPLGHEETLAIHKENMKSPKFRKNLREAVEAGKETIKKAREARRIKEAEKNNEEPQDVSVNPTN